MLGFAQMGCSKGGGGTKHQRRQCGGVHTSEEKKAALVLPQARLLTWEAGHRHLQDPQKFLLFFAWIYHEGWDFKNPLLSPP